MVCQLTTWNKQKIKMWN